MPETGHRMGYHIGRMLSAREFGFAGGRQVSALHHEKVEILAEIIVNGD